MGYFTIGLLCSLAAAAVAFWAAPSVAGYLAVLLSAAALTPVTRSAFSRHREASWAAHGDVDTATRATVPLVESILWLLLGVTAAFAVVANVLAAASRVAAFPLQSEILLGGNLPAAQTFFVSAVVSNILLCALAFLAAAFLREIGVALTISWTGSFWGVGFVSYLAGRSHGLDVIGVTLGQFSVIVLCPALIGAGAAGLFLSRGATKYGLRSSTWRGILRTCLRILGAVVLLAFISAAFTAFAQARILLGAILG